MRRIKTVVWGAVVVAGFGQGEFRPWNGTLSQPDPAASEAADLLAHLDDLADVLVADLHRDRKSPAWQSAEMMVRCCPVMLALPCRSGRKLRRFEQL